jgi:hypothetical protein
MADPTKTPQPQPAAPTLTDAELKKLGTELTWLTASNSGGDTSELTSPEMLALLEDFDSEPTADNLNLEQYRKLERDSKVAACLQIRTSAVVNRDCVIVPGGTGDLDLKAVEFCREQLLANDGRSGLLDRFTPPMLFQGLLLGFSVAEVLWKKNEQGQIVIDDVAVRDIDRFEFRRPDVPTKGAFLHYRHHLYFDGADTNQSKLPLPDRRFFCFSFGSRIGNPYGLGLGVKLWWLVFNKRRAQKFWQEYANRFADPVPYMSIDQERIGTTEQSKLDELVTQAKKFVDGLRRGTTAALPNWMEPRFLEANRGATIEVYRGLISSYDESISEIVLGNVSAGASQGFSGAPSENDETVRMEIARADAESFHGQLNNTLCQWLTELNFPGAKPPRIWRDFTLIEPLSDRAQRDSTLLQLGYRISPEAVAKIYGPDYIDTEAEAAGAQSPLAAWMSSRNTNNDTDGSLTADGVAEETDAPAEETTEETTDEPIEDVPPDEATEATTEEEPTFAEPDDFLGMTIEGMADLVGVKKSLLFSEYEAGAIEALEFGVSPREAGLARVRRRVAELVNRG